MFSFTIRTSCISPSSLLLLLLQCFTKAIYSGRKINRLADSIKVTCFKIFTGLSGITSLLMCSLKLNLVLKLMNHVAQLIFLPATNLTRYLSCSGLEGQLAPRTTNICLAWLDFSENLFSQWLHCADAQGRQQCGRSPGASRGCLPSQRFFHWSCR